MEDKHEFTELEEKFIWRKDVLEPDANFANRLEAKLLTEMKQRGKSQKEKPAFLVWKVLAVAMAALFLAVLIIGPKNVYAKLQKMFGYVENFGVVSSENGFRVLKDEVSQEKEGVVLRVSDALLGDDFSKIHYAFEGDSLVGEVFSPVPGEESCWDQGTIVLSDGRRLALGDAIPETEQKVRLIFDCIPSTVLGKAPEDWSVELVFEPAPEDMRVHEVRVLVTETNPPVETEEEPTETSPVESEPPAETDLPADSQTPSVSPEPEQTEELDLKVKQFIETDTGYILNLLIDAYYPQGWFLMSGMPKVFDANGNELILDFPNEAFENAETPAARHADEIATGESWALSFAKSELALPLEIRVESVTFQPLKQDAFPKETRVELDLSELETGGRLELNQTVMLEGEALRLESVELIEYGYRVVAQIDGELHFFRMTVEECDGVGGGGMGMGWYDPPSHEFSFHCANQPLPRKITLRLYEAVYRTDPRLWTVEWSPD